MPSYEDELAYKLQRAGDQALLKHYADNADYWQNPITLRVNNAKGNVNAGYVPQATQRDKLPANPWTVDAEAAKDPKYNGLQYAQKSGWDTFNDMMRPMGQPNQPLGDWAQRLGLKPYLSIPPKEKNRNQSFGELENRSGWYFDYAPPKLGYHLGSTNQPQWTGPQPNPWDPLKATNVVNSQPIQWSGPKADTGMTDEMVRQILTFMLGG